MSNSITLRIADITFGVEANQPLWFFKEVVFVSFIVDDCEPDVRLRFHQIPFVNDFSAPLENVNEFIQPLPWRSKLLAVLDQVEQMEVMVEKNRAFVRNFSKCELDFYYYADNRRGANREGHLKILGFALAPTLRQIFSSFLPVFSAALVHSSAVVINNLAAMFLARSTGGKTTVTKISNGNLVLSDDQVILREEAGLIQVHGTPLGRVTNGPLQAKLGGLFLLEKADSFELEKIKPLDMLEYLWNDQLIYTYSLPMDLRVKAYQMLHSACRRVPCYIMRFPKDYIDWDAINEAMRQ